jgi:hypothetical protein
MILEPPSLLSYLLGAAIMVGGVVLPLSYAFFRNNKAFAKNKS